MALHNQRSARIRSNKRADSDIDTMNDLEAYSTEEEEGYGPKRKKSRRRASKADKKKRYKHTCAYVGKLLFLVASILLIAVAALRFTVVDM
mmetsp:Transcript_31998/g.42402  ORF Transcript_31998/g.42402 Transcript_31998/m.42402 type:complete len:91 (-) Transcript_31998:755-1027(-)